MFKVILKRTVPAGKEKELLDLVTQLRIILTGKMKVMHTNFGGDALFL